MAAGRVATGRCGLTIARATTTPICANRDIRCQLSVDFRAGVAKTDPIVGRCSGLNHSERLTCWFSLTAGDKASSNNLEVPKGTRMQKPFDTSRMSQALIRTGGEQRLRGQGLEPAD